MLYLIISYLTGMRIFYITLPKTTIIIIMSTLYILFYTVLTKMTNFDL